MNEIDILVKRYRKERRDDIFRELYSKVSNMWERSSLSESSRLGVDPSTLRALYDDKLLSCIERYNEKVPFLNFLNFSIKNAKRDLLRVTKRRNERLKPLKVDTETDAPTSELVDDFNVEDYVIKKKEADKRQLIDFLLAKHQATKPNDSKTTAIVREILKDRSLSKRVNYSAIAKSLGTDDRDVQRKISKLSTYYDANRFGDICDYLAV